MAIKGKLLLNHLAELLASGQDEGDCRSSTGSETPSDSLQIPFPSVRRHTPMPSSHSQSSGKSKSTTHAKKPYSRTNTKHAKPVIKDDNDDIENECTKVTDMSSDDEEWLKPAFGSNLSSLTPAHVIISVDPTLPSTASISQTSTIDVEAYHTPPTPVTTVTASHHTESVPSTSSISMCPTCNTSFHLSLIEEHADMCCERVTRASELANTNWMLTMENQEDRDDPSSHDVDFTAQEQEKTQTELEEIIQRIGGRVSSMCSHINVQRKLILDDYIEGKKKTWIKPENCLSVVFIGEPAVDVGGPRREFFTEIFEHVKRRLFVQDGLHGFVPIESTIALTDGSFKIVGELMSMSLAQGGPAPNFLASWVYDFLSSGLDGVQAQIENMQDGKFKRVAEKIMAVETEQDLQKVLTEDDSMDILSKVGYRGVPQREKLKIKDKILRSVYIKEYVEPKIPMLNQIAKGLELYGVLDEITMNREEMRKVFTLDNFEEITSESLRGMCSVKFSLAQKSKEKEMLTYKAFADFICMIEYEGMSKYEISLADILKFITGCTQVPPLGFSKKIAITFVHGCESGCKCRPTASTCTLELRLPIHIKSFDDMVSCGVSMLKECFGFGSV